MGRIVSGYFNSLEKQLRESGLGGNLIQGPAIVEEPATTIVIPERYSARVDDYKNYLVQRQ